MLYISGSLSHRLQALYGEKASEQYKRYEAVSGGIYRIFKQEPEYFFSVPGRSELGGNHTDHQHGCVLTAAVDLDTIAAVKKENGKTISVYSEGYPPFEIDLCALNPATEEAGTPASLVRGIAARMAEFGYSTGGFCAYVSSDVLPGSGLSSSASFEVLAGAIFNKLFNDNQISAMEIAKISRFAENEYFGKPCGLRDQMACALGGVCYIDFKDIEIPVYSKIPFDLSKHGYSMCITNTGGNHESLTDEYAAITREMRNIAERMGEKYLRFCDEDKFFSSLPEFRKTCTDRAVLRACHFFSENKRPDIMAAALSTGDFKTFLELVNESGRSSFQYLENVSAGKPESQPLGIGLAVSENVLCGQGASRVHGGGFAGTIQAYVPFNLLENYIVTMENIFGKGCCRPLSFREEGPVSFNACRGEY